MKENTKRICFALATLLVITISVGLEDVNIYYIIKWPMRILSGFFLYLVYSPNLQIDDLENTKQII